MCIRDRGHADLELLPGRTRRLCAEVLPQGLDLQDLGGGTRCLLYTSDAADERSSVDLGGRRIIKKKTKYEVCDGTL